MAGILPQLPTNPARQAIADMQRNVANVNVDPASAKRVFDADLDLSNISDYLTAMREAELSQQEFNQNSADKAMQFEADQARINREWQERMSNTSYQRAIRDLRKAGLNPLLAYTQGGAGTPSGAVASGAQASSSARQVSSSLLETKKDQVEQIFKIIDSGVSTANKATSIIARLIALFG